MSNNLSVSSWKYQSYNHNSTDKRKCQQKIRNLEKWLKVYSNYELYRQDMRSIVWTINSLRNKIHSG